MDAARIAAARMRNQRLWGTPMATPAEVVRWLGAMQAQEYLPAKWAIAQRCERVTDAGMERAFAAGTILRTHVVRPTWHFVLPEDIRWLLAVTGPRVNALNAYQYRRLGLDDDAFATCNALLAEALRGGNQLTRGQLAGWLERNGVKASGPHLAHLLMRAELDAVICSGAPSGRQQTYALLDERVPQGRSLSQEAALAELTRRYFTSRGPATLADYARWSSLTMADARAGLEMVGSELERMEAGGRTWWLAAGATAATPPPPVIDLVQGYDECIMSYSETREVLYAPGFQGTVPAGVPYLHAILLDGRLIGRWRHLLNRREVVLETLLHRPLGGAEAAAMDAAVRRFGDYVGVPASWRPATG